MRIFYALAAVLALLVSEGSAEENVSKAALDRLHAAPKPGGQKDLDTMNLASAHREKSASAAERTNGLWQSWVVAICQGCGVNEHRPSKDDEDAMVARARARLPPEPKHEERSAEVRASRIVIEPIAMLEERKPAIVMVPRHSTLP